MKPLTRLRLLWSSLTRRRLRSAALVATVAVLVGGVGFLTALLRGLSAAVSEGTARFGAELVVIPRGSRAAIEGALIVGQPSQLTMPAAVLDQLRELPEVGAISPQVFVQTLNDARCCPGEFFLIGYDPATDFTVAPWLAEHNQSNGEFDAVVGDRVTLRVGDGVTFFGTPFTIAGRLDATGVGIDNTVFIPIDGMRQMIHDSATKAEEALAIPDDVISVVMAKAAEGYLPSDAAEAISNRVDGMEVILAPNVIGSATRRLGSVLRALMLLAGALWLVFVPVLGSVFSMSLAERRREIGLWRALGATSREVFALVVAEAVLLCGMGAGVAAGLLLFLRILFGAMFASGLDMPFVLPSLGWLAVALGILAVAALATGLLASWLPARSAAAAEPYECLRGVA